MPLTDHHLERIRERQKCGTMTAAVPDRTVLLAELDAERAAHGETCRALDEERALHAKTREELDAAYDALANYGTHDSKCVHSRCDAGRPTPSGGYEWCFAGTWYEVRPNDCTPPCTCGFTAALKREREGE